MRKFKWVQERVGIEFEIELSAELALDIITNRHPNLKFENGWLYCSVKHTDGCWYQLNNASKNGKDILHFEECLEKASELPCEDSVTENRHFRCGVRRWEDGRELTLSTEVLTKVPRTTCRILEDAKIAFEEKAFKRDEGIWQS